jgi:imidazolonepropionase-like amidohydrolase
MGQYTRSLALGIAVAMLVAAPVTVAQRSAATLFRGMRIITGEPRPPIENGAVLVEGGRITQIGASATVGAPGGATVVDWRGKTIMPALIDGHSHLGYTDVRTGTTAAANYTRDNLLDHLRRYAYYGVAATLSMGLDRGELPYQLRRQTAPDAARFLTAGRGIAMPSAGPRAEHWRDAAYGVTTEAEARVAVRALAARKVDLVKIWVDDSDRTVTPLPPRLYRPIIDEAHAHGLRVVAHVFYLADAKQLLRAGIDGFAHGIRDREVDEEILELFKTRRHVFVMPNLPDTPEGATVRPPLWTVQARSLPRLAGAGVTIGFGTDAGVGAPYGRAAHDELADMVAAGLTPADAIIAATATTAAILRLADLGSLAVGKSADFLVLDANPLDDITHTRRIAGVYLRGARVNREQLRGAWTDVTP